MSSATTSPRTARVKAAPSEELALFHRTLAELCKAAVPLPKAFRILQADLKRGRFREAVDEMAGDVESGIPLGEAYARRKGRFPPLYSALVEIGMIAGDLPGVLEEISRHAAQRAKVAARLQRALAYPLVTAAFVLVAGVGLLALVAPRLWEFPAQMGLASPAPYALGALGVLAFLAVLGARWRFPFFGRIRRSAAQASLASTLALLLRREVPLPTALSLTAEATEDPRLAGSLREVAERASTGEGLVPALRETRAFEPTTLWLLEAADGSNDLPGALDDAAAIYRARLGRATDRLATIVTPLAELTIGIVVFVFAYSFMVPLFDFALELFRL